jgi:lactoylglutathione lyase
LYDGARDQQTAKQARAGRSTLSQGGLPQHPGTDLDAALAFYSGNLRHELIWRSNTAAGLRLPDSSAELVLHTDDRPMETNLSVESVPEALAKFTSAGGKVLAGPFEIPIGLCAVVSDPWDNALVILDVSKGHLRVDENRRVIEGPVTYRAGGNR